MDLKQIIENLIKFEKQTNLLFEEIKNNNNFQLVQKYTEYVDVFNSLNSINDSVVKLLSNKKPKTSFEKYIDQNFKNKDLSKITKLFISEKELKDLNGIEKFINLKVLDISNNKLTDLNGIEKLKLTEIYCSNNQLTSLNGLENMPLKYLHCNNNELVNLEFVPPTIEHIFCENNNVDNIDIIYTLNNLITLFIKNNVVLDVKIPIKNLNI